MEPEARIAVLIRLHLLTPRVGSCDTEVGVGRKKDRARQHMEVYAAQCMRCAVCWWRRGRAGRRLELHHIVGRRGLDYHHHRNLIAVCNECHGGYHSGGSRSLSLGQILTAKEQEDGEVDLEFLAGLLRRVGLREDPAPLPAWVEQERAVNGRR